MADAKILSELEAKYCPPIDGALFSAIALDHDDDLSNSENLQSLCAILDALKATAQEQEDTGFDPSGTGAGGADSVVDATSQHGGSSPERQGNAGTATSLPTDLQSLDIGSGSEQESYFETGSRDGTANYAQDLDELANNEKLQLLQAAFPDSTHHTIADTLDKSQGKVDRAMDDLLNQAYLMEEKQASQASIVLHKGVDDFSEDNAARRGRKKARKKKAQARSDETDKRGASLPSTPIRDGVTSWKNGQDDIDFIKSRVNISRGIVSTLFYKHGASVPKTILAMINDSALTPPAPRLESEDPVIQANAFELGQDFPKIPSSQLTALIHLTHPSTSCAYDLAQIISKNRNELPTLKVVTQYEPLHIEEDYGSPDEWTTVSNSKGWSPTGNTNGKSALAKTFALRDQRARVQASSAARKARSNHLMNGASAYYSQVSRDEAIARRSLSAQQANAHVRAQSTRGMIDLHGVSVPDAIRIARMKTQEWWQSSGRRIKGFDGRVSAANGDAPRTFNIITGLGHHSEGGRAKIGPAVGRMLEREGWHVAYDEGVLTVSGKH